jgi:hypothetical protein
MNWMTLCLVVDGGGSLIHPDHHHHHPDLVADHLMLLKEEDEVARGHLGTGKAFLERRGMAATIVTNGRWKHLQVLSTRTPLRLKNPVSLEIGSRGLPSLDVVASHPSPGEVAIHQKQSHVALIETALSNSMTGAKIDLDREIHHPNVQNLHDINSPPTRNCAMRNHAGALIEKILGEGALIEKTLGDSAPIGKTRQERVSKETNFQERATTEKTLGEVGRTTAKISSRAKTMERLLRLDLDSK